MANAITRFERERERQAREAAMQREVELQREMANTLRTLQYGLSGSTLTNGGAYISASSTGAEWVRIDATSPYTVTSTLAPYGNLGFTAEFDLHEEAPEPKVDFAEPFRRKIDTRYIFD